MSKRGDNQFEKQSSTMSNARVLDLMREYHFAVQRVEVPIEPKKTTRQAVVKAQRDFGKHAHISSTGECIYWQGIHLETEQRVRNIRIKLSHMAGIGELEALYDATGIPEFKQC